MKGRTLAVLALVGLALVVAAIWLASSRQPQGGTPERALLLPELQAQLNAIERVRIVGADGEAVLERSDAGWTMPARDGWPVDTGKLRELLLSLAQARTVEPKTSNPELHAKLGVEAVGEGSGSGVLVELAAGEDTRALIVGNANATGSHVRLADQPQSWLLDRRITVDRQPTAWLQRELTQIDAQRVAELRIAPAEGGAVEIVARDPGPGFDIANLPKGREPASDYVAEATAGFLSALRLDDVARAGEAPFGEGAEPAHARFALRDGIVVELEFAEREGALLARFDVSVDAERAQAFATAEQAKAAMEYERSHPAAAAPAADAAGAAPDAEPPPLAVTDPDADRAARLAAVHEEAATLEQRLEGWVFTLPPYKAEHLTKPLADYLAPQP